MVFRAVLALAIHDFFLRVFILKKNIYIIIQQIIPTNTLNKSEWFDNEIILNVKIAA